jgi:hypothetical protein
MASSGSAKSFQETAFRQASPEAPPLTHFVIWAASSSQRLLTLRVDRCPEFRDQPAVRARGHSRVRLERGGYLRVRGNPGFHWHAERRC